MTYVAVVRTRGPAWRPERQMSDQAAWPEHAAFMNALAADGFVVGGPLGEGTEVLLMVDAADEDMIRERLAADPWAASGLLTIARVERWHVLLGGVPSPS